MRQSQRLFTAGVLLAVAASVFIGLLAVPKREAVGATTPQVIPQMFTLFVIPQTGSTESQIQGTGTLINQTQGNIATARHVIEALEKMPRSALFAQVDGVLYPLEALWKHKTADIAVVRFVETHKPQHIPSELTVVKELPAIGSPARLLGYFYADKRSTTHACEESKRWFYCEKAVPLTITLVDAKMEQLSTPTATDQLVQFMELTKTDPALSFEDVFYDQHIAATTSDKKRSEKYFGMSGGALVNQRGELLGVYVSMSTYLIFVPAREIPDEYLPRPSVEGCLCFLPNV